MPWCVLCFETRLSYVSTAADDRATRPQWPTESKSYAQRLLDVFLPAGYPHTVTEDYMQ